MRKLRSIAFFAAGVLAVTASTAHGAEPIACSGPDRIDLDLTAWRQRVLKAGSDARALERELGAAGFDLEALMCLQEGKVIAVDVFPATFGPRAKADRVVQIRTQRCIIERDLVVLTGQAEGIWCKAQGELYKGGSSNGCSFAPPLIQLVHLTDSGRDTLRILSVQSGGATADNGEKICARTQFVSFWDVEEQLLVPRLWVPDGPMTFVGKSFPRVVRAFDADRNIRTYRFNGKQYEPDPVRAK